jgi:hypothetical protein
VNKPNDYAESLGGLKVKSGFAEFISVITVEVIDVFDSFYLFPDDVGIMWQFAIFSILLKLMLYLILMVCLACACCNFKIKQF